MDSGTPSSKSFSGTKQTSRTTGPELCGRLVLLSLGLLSLGRPGTHQVLLLGKAMRRLMLLSPLLHLGHLVLLSLGLLSLGRPGTHHVWLPSGRAPLCRGITVYWPSCVNGTRRRKPLRRQGTPCNTCATKRRRSAVTPATTRPPLPRTISSTTATPASSLVASPRTKGWRDTLAHVLATRMTCTKLQHAPRSSRTLGSAGKRPSCPRAQGARRLMMTSRRTDR